MPKQSQLPVDRLIAAVEQAYDCVAISDTRGVLEYVNPAFESMSGYSADEVLGSTFKRLQSGIHDEAFYDDLRATLASGECWHGHFINRKKDGSLYEEEATISPVRDGNGVVTGYVAVKRDVTKERALSREVDEARVRATAFEAEREVLEQTVTGTVRMLTEVLAMMRAASFGRSTRIAAYVDAVCAELDIEDWHLRMAAMLSQVGVVAIPAELHEKAILGLDLSEGERALYDSHPLLAMRLLSGVPRLERVATIVGSLCPDGSPDSEAAHPTGAHEGIPIREAATILRAAIVFDDAMRSWAGRDQAIAILRSLEPPLPADLVNAFTQVPIAEDRVSEQAIRLQELAPGMHLKSDVLSEKGMLLVRGDQQVTLTMLGHLRKIAAAHGVREPIHVLATDYAPGAALI